MQSVLTNRVLTWPCDSKCINNRNLTHLLIFSFIHNFLFSLYFSCRNTQAIFDSCMLTNFGMERPHFGYLCEPRIHHTQRQKPLPEPPAVYPDALPDLPSEDIPRPAAKYGTRMPMG